MTNLSIDLETYSDVDLTKCGVYKYIESPNFAQAKLMYSDGSDELANAITEANQSYNESNAHINAANAERRNLRHKAFGNYSWR